VSTYTNVLMIEDNPGDARLVRGYLDEGFGQACAVRQAATLADGLDALRAEAADVVLLDLGLPDSQGLAGFVAVQRTAPGTPVVILTGQDDEQLALEALGTGADDYLAKADTDSVTLLRAMRHATQRRQLSERLRKSEAQFRAIVETAEEGILLLGPDGQAHCVNRRAREMLGLGAGPVPGAPEGLQFLDHVGAQDHALTRALLHTAPGARTRHELRLQAPDGVPAWVLAAAGGVLPSPGAEPQVVMLLTDIDRLKRAEQASAAAQSELACGLADRTILLERANTELRALSRTLAHDLRSPLNGIISLTRLVSEEAQAILSTTAWRRLKLVEYSALEMNTLIGSLLELRAPRQHDIEREALDLSAMALSIAERLDAAEPQRRVRWRIAAGLSASGDRALVNSVLQNLLENAWKYTRTQAQAEVEFGCERPGEAGPVYVVRDNGVGFDMAQAGRLFAAYERLPTSAGHEGTGMGLFSARRIIERHGGGIWAESAAGAGAVFRFTLGQAPRAR
jgi:PAS domain S-box-containing protein